jgi:glycolate oxidase FAD binding subunit
MDQLFARLEAALGAGAVESDPRLLDCYTVDGKAPKILCRPGTPEEISAGLRICTEARVSVIPWGGGTSINLGNIPRGVDVVIGLERLGAVIEHDGANLTATGQAGISVAAMQKILGQQNQFLAIDPPQPGLATIGGLVAANSNGPRRMLYGGVRDLVLGMKMVLATGEQIKAGGKVVKNVAGYDLCKLFVGSLGTLGIITEATFKMAPIPESVATLLARGSLTQVLKVSDELSRSTLLPAGVAILSSEVIKAAGMGLGMSAVAVWIEGLEEAVSRHLRDLKTIAERLGLSSDTLRREPHRRLWDQVRDFGANSEGILYRVTVPLASVAEAVATIDRWSTHERVARIVAHVGTGTVWVLLDADPLSAGWFPRLIALAQEHRGHAIMAAAPRALKEGVDVWGPPPPSFAIMREIKHQFDPEGILNPGRFVAGL